MYEKLLPAFGINQDDLSEPPYQPEDDDQYFGGHNLRLQWIFHGLLAGLLLAMPLHSAMTYLSPAESELGLVTYFESQSWESAGQVLVEITAPSGTWQLQIDQVTNEKATSQALRRAQSEPIEVIYSSLSNALVAVPELGRDGRELKRVLWPALTMLTFLAASAFTFVLRINPQHRKSAVIFFGGFLFIGTPLGLAVMQGLQDFWQRAPG